jgi:hypothetical protein
MRTFPLEIDWKTVFMFLLAPLLAIPAQSQDPAAAPGRLLLQKYAGSYDTDALFNELQIRENLQQLLGEELPHLERNLDVKGAIDVISGALSITGNAPHQGTEEEAVVCVNSYNMELSAAIYSNGTITVYSREGQYENLPLCIKDWITLVNSGHTDRLMHPNNVRMAANQ